MKEETYKGYVLKRVQYDHRVTAAVQVFDPRWPDKPVYAHPNADGAKRWVTAYRDGVTWAALDHTRLAT